MKILYIVGDPSIKLSDNVGYTRHITECIHALGQLGVDVCLITANDDGTAARQKQLFGKAKRLMPSKISALLKDMAKIKFDRRFQTEVQSAIEKFEPDIVYNRYAVFHKSAVETARRLRVPIVLEVNATLQEATKYYGLGLESVATRTERHVFEKSDAIFVVSSPLKTDLVGYGVPEDKIYVNPNGVDPEKFSPFVDGGDLRTRYGLEGHRVVGFIGSLVVWSGVNVLIESAKTICAKYPEVRFLIVGSGYQDSLLKKKVNEYRLEDRITFIGRVPMDEVPVYLSAMDIAAVPYSDPEQVYGSSTKFYESMASGKAIVASNVAQMGEVIEDNVNGLLVIPGDVSDLTKKITYLLDHPKVCSDMGVKARETVLNKHTWRQNAERILDVCRTMTEG